ncbi:hypothetical protein GBF38_004883 [Nibea albiflora]|uniref:Uncharacterized protein n=1 Tax=Nibea albiflora TaxID=240163 RepID=A0ACB7EV10_NIBAL|nr:hypothetical protein GBF38_004883 [Nibea albiflora]
MYDITLTDGDCRLAVTLDPGLNGCGEKLLQPGSVLLTHLHPRHGRSVTTMLRGRDRQVGEDSYRLLSVEVTDGAPGEEEEQGGVRRDDVPWFGSSEPSGESRLKSDCNFTAN